MVGFDFDKSSETVDLNEYKKETLTDALYALELHIKNEGGQVKSDAVFDPYKSSIATTDAKKTVQPIPASGKSGGPIDTYDPTAVQSEIQKIQDERMVSFHSVISLYRKS